jgi:hypothetical protein
MAGYSISMGACTPYPKNCLQANEYGFCYLCETTVPLAAILDKLTWKDEQYDEYQDNVEEEETSASGGLIDLVEETAEETAL